MILSNINPVLSPSCKKLKFEFGQETVANLKMHLALSSEILQVKSVAK